jgi:hypothetical protein
VEGDIKYYSTWSNYIGACIAIVDEAPSSTKDNNFLYNCPLWKRLSEEEEIMCLLII